MPNPPNSRIVYSSSTCQLAYWLRTDPAEVSVSVPGANAATATLTLTVANKTGAPIKVRSVAITIPTGNGEFALATGITDADAAPSSQWQIDPAGIEVSGSAVFVVTPRASATGTLAAGASISVIFSDVEINTVPGPVAIVIDESIGTATPPVEGRMTIMLVKHPPGFFFDSLIVNTGTGTDLQPVAQVPYQTPVTLSWNVSDVDLTSIAIFQSSNAGPCPPVTPTKMNQWTTPAGLLADTIFTVVVTTSTPSGDRIGGALSTAVAVQRPDAVLNEVSIFGPLYVYNSAFVAGSFTSANGATVSNGLLNATAGATVSGAALTAVNGAVVTNGLSTDVLTVSGTLNGLNAPLQVAGELVVGGYVTLKSGISAAGIALSTSGGISIGSWTFGLDANNNLNISNSAGHGQLCYNGQPVIANNSTVYISNNYGWLNGTRAFLKGVNGWNAGAFWMENWPDDNSRLTVTVNRPGP